MSGYEMQLLQALAKSEWLDVVAMPVQNNRDILLDIVFSTQFGRISLSGKAHWLPDGSEVFSLDIYTYQPGGWWAPSEGSSGVWVPRDIKRDLESGSSKSLLSPPREIRFFADPLLLRCPSNKASMLDIVSGIEFLKQTDSTTAKMVLVASTGYPCAIEFGIGPAACKSVLRYDEANFNLRYEGRMWG